MNKPHPNKLPFNDFVVQSGIAYITLTQGKVALLDEADLPLVQHLRWHTDKSKKSFYARANDYTSGKRRSVRMHSVILPPREGYTPDHLDKDGLNNTRSNLKYATLSEQNRNQTLRTTNKSGYRGVSFNKRRDCWLARGKVNGVIHHLGYYATLEGAVSARQVFDELYTIPPADNRIAVPATEPPQGHLQLTRKPGQFESGVRGVSWDTSSKRWRTRISVHGKTINIGTFTNLEDAIAARRAWDAEHSIPPV